MGKDTRQVREVADVSHVERAAPMTATDRLKLTGSPDERFYEIGLHLVDSDRGSDVIRTRFEQFATEANVQLHTQLSFRVGNLWFLPAEGDLASMRRIAEFTFVRVIRPLPRLRSLHPLMRASAATVPFQLPNTQPLSSDPRVAILDAGLPKAHLLGPWMRMYKRMDEKADYAADGQSHGLAVTSAALFGPIAPNGMAPRPYAPVDHLRVLDRESSHEDPLELYRTLGFVEEVLLSRQYEFVNLSLGPALPIEDTDVHAWTSVIDEILNDGNTFVTVAVGNNGDNDRASGNARIQVPADCVNAVAVGAASSISAHWRRASYSAIGPGRRPGIIKPDLVGFGGDGGEYFHVVAEGNAPQLAPQLGTSFAAPNILRSAVGIRAVLGPSIRPLTIKALLVHAAETGAGHDPREVGWGRVPDDLAAIIETAPGVARIIYQGELRSSKYLRARIPIPIGGMKGRVKLRATFCFASKIDPQDAVAYTRAGLEVTFRPDSRKKEPGKLNASSRGFFDNAPYAHETELRTERGKWETVMHAQDGMLGSSLFEPAFDIHYVAREGGGAASKADKIPYALVISVEAAKHADLYSQILTDYPALVPIQPQIPIPIRT